MDDKALEARAYRTFPESDDRAQRCLAALREVAEEWAEEVKAEARDCGCWERILRRRGEK